MSEETKHSPTPWHVSWQSLDDSVEVNDSGNNPVANYCGHVDAEFICRAVNAHEALVAACEAAVREFSLGATGASEVDALIQLRAAIKLAKGAA